MRDWPLFVTFEGIEGSGKTTQSRILAERLKVEGYSVVLTYEPGGTVLGEEVRHILLTAPANSITPRAELLLFAAARAQLVTQVIEPAILQGQIIVCDRFAESSLAYQGYGRGLPLEVVRAANAIATGERRADLVILLDLPVELGLQRKDRPDWNRFEQEDLDFHRRVREGYLQLVKEEPGRWLVIDARLPIEEVSRLIWQRVSSELRTRREGAPKS